MDQSDPEKLRPLLEQLGTAIKDSIGESDAVAEAVEEARRAGFDLSIILEATIGFKKIGHEQLIPAEPALTKQDKKFLRALKILPPDDE